MAGKGPPPKPAAIRQRQNRKPGARMLEAPADPKSVKVPTLPNPDKRKWHRLTRAWWKRVWQSPMADEYIDADLDGLGRLAILIDQYYKTLRPKLLAEIRLQEARFGLSPVDRSRLQWEVAKGEEATRSRRPRSEADTDDTHDDPRKSIKLVN